MDQTQNMSKQRGQTQNKSRQVEMTQNMRRQRSYSSDNSDNSLPNKFTAIKNEQPSVEMVTENNYQAKPRRQIGQQAQYSPSAESSVRMNIGTVQFNTIQYSDSRSKSSRNTGILRKYPTTDNVRVPTTSESSDNDDGFIEAIQENDIKTSSQHFNRQVERGYRK